MYNPSTTAVTHSGFASAPVLQPVAVRPSVFGSASAFQPAVNFREPAAWTDLTIVVKEREFHFCRTILCAASPVFNAMLTQDVKEKDAKLIELPDDNPSVLEELLLLLSPKHQLNLTEQNMPTVLSIANKYEVTHILDYCEEHFIKLLPPSFHLKKPNNLLCPRDFFSKVSKAVCRVDLNDWLESYKSYGRFSCSGARAMPWWCALLLVYRVAKVCNLSNLKKGAWEKLMCTNSSSVWLSSIGQNPEQDPFSYGSFQPLCDENTEIDRRKARFVLFGMKTMPFFTSLDPEEKIDLLLSFTTFEANWKH